MAGSKLNTYAVGNEDITAVMDTLNKVSIGVHAASLTEWDTTTIPQIAAGARVECAGAIFEFLSNEAIGGTAVDGTNYIKLIPAGSSITAEWTQTAPVWDTAYSGWYSPTVDEGTYRYLEFYVVKASTTYYKYDMNRYRNSQPFAHGLAILDTYTFTSVTLWTYVEFEILKAGMFYLHPNIGTPGRQYIWIDGAWVSQGFISYNSPAFIYPGKYKIGNYPVGSVTGSLKCSFVEGLPVLVDGVGDSIYTFLSQYEGA